MESKVDHGKFEHKTESEETPWGILPSMLTILPACHHDNKKNKNKFLLFIYHSTSNSFENKFNSHDYYSTYPYYNHHTIYKQG